LHEYFDIARACGSVAAHLRLRVREEPFVYSHALEAVKSWLDQLQEPLFREFLSRPRADGLDPVADGTPVTYAGVTSTSYHRIACRLAWQTEEAITEGLKDAYYAGIRAGKIRAPFPPRDDLEGRWAPESWGRVLDNLRQLPAFDPEELRSLIECEHVRARNRQTAEGAASGTRGDLPPARPVQVQTDKKPRLSKGEAEVRVKKYLLAHRARARKGEISIREVVQETGVPQTSVQRTNAWTGIQDRLAQTGQSRRPQRRKAQTYSNTMDAVAQHPEAMMAELIRQQAADDEGSPLDTGRRGPARIRKKV
jgi:hypothetical protein